MTEALDAAKGALDGLAKDRKRLELEVQDFEAKRSKYKGQLGEVKTNKEYTALLHEIENVEREIRSREDQILEAMEKEDCESWLRGKTLIDTLLQSEPFISPSFKFAIKDAFSKIKNVLMLVYVHSLGIDPASYYSYKDPFNDKWKDIVLDKQSTY